MIDLNQHENELRSQGYHHIAGTDEAGRGCLAGPVVIASIILPENYTLPGVNDSKQLSEKKREELYPILLRDALDYCVTFIYEKEIDEINIYEASRKGMYLCIEGLKKIKPDYVLSDAMPLPKLSIPHESIIHGDANCFCIAAASILAKVSRDHYMILMDQIYPEYGFKDHKGYGTKKHLQALQEYGVLPIHRKTYEPVREVLFKRNTLDI